MTELLQFHYSVKMFVRWAFKGILHGGQLNRRAGLNPDALN